MITGLSITSSVFPSQLVDTEKKQDEKWQKDCVDGGINKVLYTNDYMRKSKQDKVENYSIVHGKFDRKKLLAHLNPLMLEQDDMDDDVYELFGDSDGYAIILAPLKTLFGEELKRNFDPRAYVVNADAVSEKERLIKDKVNKFLDELLQEQLSEDEVKKRTEQLLQWKNKDAQTIHETMANNTLKHFLPKQQFKWKMNDCWKDLCIAAEESVYIGDANGEPYIRKTNPLQIMWYGNGQSNKIQDATIIVEWGYYSISAILTEFGKKIKEEDLIKLENYLNYGTTSSGSLIKTAQVAPFVNIHNVMLPLDDMSYSETGFSPFGYTWYDRQGNILVVRVNWLSQRKIGDLSYPDEFGETQHKFVPEWYKVNKDVGETVDWFWINEWMSGIKIGYDIYADIKVNEVQYRSITNPAICRPPYVGIVSNINSGRAYSIVDSIKEFAYEYIVYAKKLKHLWLTNLGRIANIDTASIPTGMMEDGSKWDLKRWFNFIKTHRIALRNSFQEDNKGHAVGNMQSQTGYIDMTATTEIDQIIRYLEYIESKIDKLSGVSPQRQGDIAPSQGLGTSNQAVAYSATQTEDLFNMHEEFKLDVLRFFLEQAKWCLKDKKVLVQNILDDQQIKLIEIDGALFSEAEYDIQITNSYKLQEFERILKGDILSRAVQNGSVQISDVAEMMLSNSPTDMINRLKVGENKKIEMEQQNQQQQLQMQQKQLDVQREMLALQHKNKLEEMAFQRETDMMKLQLQLQDKANADVFGQYYKDTNLNGIDDNIELKKQELVNTDKEKQRTHDATQSEKDRKLQLDLTEKDNQTKLKIAHSKKSTTN